MEAEERFAIPGAGGLIRSRHGGEEWILVQERDKPGAPAETGLLEIPAGKVRAFESIYDCLRREIREETGCVVARIQGEEEAVSVSLHGYRVLSYTPYSSAQNLEGVYPIMVQTFLCDVDGPPAEGFTRSNESRHIRWIRRKELARLVREEPARFYPMHLATLRRYLSE